MIVGPKFFYQEPSGICTLDLFALMNRFFSEFIEIII